MKLNLIYASSVYNCIGSSSKGLIWNIQEELKYFYNTTSEGESVLIMGRKTYDMIKDKLKKNNRKYIVFTHQHLFQDVENVCVYNNVYKCIDDIYNLKENKEKTFWVIGGKQIFELFEPFVEKIYLSNIHFYHKVDSFSDYIYYKHNTYDFECVSSVQKKSYESNTQQDLLIEYKIYERIIQPANMCFKNHFEYIYLEVLKKCVKANKRQTRNGQVYSYFGEQLRIDVSSSLPILTTKRMFIRGIVEELLFFISGKTDTKILEKKQVNIWKGNSSKSFIEKMNLDYEDGDIGPMYGFQWRHYGAEYTTCADDYTGKGFDQLKFVINEIIKEPHSRRIMMTSFHPTDAFKSVLYPCHSIVLQFYVEDCPIFKNKLISVHMYQRSADVFLGLPFNITSTALLLYLICHECNRICEKEIYKPKDLIISLGDIHLYEEHLEMAKVQLKRTPLTSSICKISNKEKSIFDIEYQDLNVSISNYYSYDNLKVEMKS